MNMDPTKTNSYKEWRINKKKTFIQSELLLNHGFAHAFFTKNVINDYSEKLIETLFENSTKHKLVQVHSNKIINASETKGPDWSKADGLISDNSNISQSLWIYTADCIPMLIANIKTGQVSAIHIGWKGLASKIIRESLNKLELYGSSKKDLIIALGPSISKIKYSVRSDILASIMKSINPNNSSGMQENINHKLIRMHSKKILEETEIKDEFLIDIRLIALKQLMNSGIKASQVSINSNCTYLDKNLFHSWRRDKTKGRQWSVILSKNI